MFVLLMSEHNITFPWYMSLYIYILSECSKTRGRSIHTHRRILIWCTLLLLVSLNAFLVRQIVISP